MRPNRASPKPISGYAYGTRQHWQESSDEDWDQELYTPTGDEKFIGVRSIDGSRVNVWRSGREYVAQLEHMTRNHKGLLRRNPGAPPPPPVRRRRRPVDPSLRGVRSMVEREERPFDPDARYPRETKRHHFAINPRGTTGIPAHLKELRVEEPEFNGQDVGYSTYNFGKARSGEPQWYEVGYATGSDYSGGTVELSNYRVLKEMLEEHHPEDQKPVCWVIASGGYSTFSIAVLWDELDDEIKEALAGLEDYPLLDEEAHSELEMKLQDEAWEENYREEFKKEVTKIIDEEEDEDGEWPASDDDADTLFRLAMETSNEQWIHENLGSWPYLHLDRIASAAAQILTGEVERDWFSPEDDKALERIREGFELEAE